MIPDIGLIISVYTLSRLAAMLGQPTSQTNTTAKILSALAILVTLVALVDLFQHTTPVPR